MYDNDNNVMWIKGAEEITDQMLYAASMAYKQPNRIQGFKYGREYVVRDVWKNSVEQVLWRGNDSDEFERQCDIARMRLAFAAALGSMPRNTT